MDIAKIYGIIETTEDSCFEEFHTTPKGAEEAIAKRPRKRWSGGGDRYTTEELDLIVDPGSEVIPCHTVAEAMAALQASLEQQVLLIGGVNADYGEGVKFALKGLSVTIARLGLDVADK